MQVCRALLEPVRVQDTVVNMVFNGGAELLLITKGHARQEQNRLESAGTNWNWLEPARCSPYTSRLAASGLLTSVWDSSWTLTSPH